MPNPRPLTTTATAHRNELIVLALIGGGMVLIIILIVCGLFGWFPSRSGKELPNWAENVLIGLVSVMGLKLGDVLNALVTLATGRQVESFGNKLADSAPSIKAVSSTAAEAADQVAEAAENEAATISAQAEKPDV
jgi:hypothetical protein